MEEELISFETAKLAKEKGFDWDILHTYRDGKLDYEDYYRGTIDELYFNANGRNITKFKEIISAPTQSLLQKWLREVHGIDVLVDKGVLCDKYSYEIYHKNDMLDSEYVFKTYEEALEIGLYKSLKLI